jgi:hypothetical protein
VHFVDILTKDNLVDIFTKVLPAPTFKQFRDLTGLKLPPNRGGALGTAEQSQRSAIFGIHRATAFYERDTPKLRLSSVSLQCY